MAPKFEDLQGMPHPQLREELAGMKRTQLVSLAKKCGIKANQRTLELTGAIAEYFIRQKNLAAGEELGITPDATGIYPRRPSEGLQLEQTLHKTPFNPVFNPRYAPTDTRKAAAILRTDGSQASTGGPSRKNWHVTKSKELAELEAALKSLPPAKQKGAEGTTPAATQRKTLKIMSKVSGLKRKAPDGAAETPLEQPAAKRLPGTTPADTLALKAAIIRRPGGQKQVRGPSRLGRTPGAAAVPRWPLIAAPQSVAKAPGSAMRLTSAARASKAHDAYIARMRKAKQGKV